MTEARASELTEEIVAFVTKVLEAMGATPTVTADEGADGIRVDVEGDGAEVLLFHRGEALRALQTIVNAAFRKPLGEDRKVLVDCQGFRRDKDAELKQMARFLAEKVASSGVPQEIGPLNSYERRIVHLTVAELEGVASESIGDAAVKTVIISPRGK
jgi:spoIIIJ-associated protein